MDTTIIRIEHLSKQYQIGVPRAKYRTFHEELAKTIRKPFTWLKNDRKKANSTIWALNDVSFEVMQGETVGIIGRNGAGKSTLLKILSRITSPTRGRVELRGRVGSLLEVGTGFHPELTGRENIFLNGAILGMHRQEIRHKFDEIVAFAEIEKFLDTPVKRYSSGMYVRLAFAVAAHLEPEILLVDEVLAVGDAAFQKKCLGKMENVSREGRTILFISHNMNAIATLCNRCLIIKDGELIRDGNTAEIISFYYSNFISETNGTTDLREAERYGTGKAKFTLLTISPQTQDNSLPQSIVTGRDVKIVLHVAAYEKIRDANVAITVYDALGYRLIDANTALHGDFLNLEKGQQTRVEFQLQNLLLKPGKYMLGVWLGQATFSENIDGIRHATSFSVVANPDAIKHSFEFPGTYQCNFSQKIYPPEPPVEKAR